MSGWIKLHRKMIKWEWYKKPEMVHLFLYLLFRANHEDQKWQGIDIKRGQILTGRRKLSFETGISERSIRTCIKRLKSTSELTIETTSRYSLITITNYEFYQSCEIKRPEERPTNSPTTDQRPTSDRPATDQRPTTNKNIKNINKEEKPEESKKKRINTSEIDTDFETFWNEYPGKEGKAGAKKHFTKLVKNKKETVEDLILSAKNYGSYCNIKNTERKYIKKGYNFFNDDFYKDFMQEYVPPALPHDPWDWDANDPFGDKANKAKIVESEVL